MLTKDLNDQLDMERREEWAARATALAKRVYIPAPLHESDTSQDLAYLSTHHWSYLSFASANKTNILAK
jgi:hypothetical protein